MDSKISKVMPRERYLFLDVARGMAIILVILGHCCVPAKIFMNEILLSVHMPLFFFLSGIFLKEPKKGFYIQYITKRCKKIIVPHLTMAVITAVCSIVVGGVVRSELSFSDTILRPFLYWFLPVLLICFLLMILLLRLAKGKRSAAMLGLIVALILVYPSLVLEDYVDNQLTSILTQSALRIICITPSAFLFFSLGFIMKDTVIRYFANYDINVKRGIINIFLVCAFIVIAERNGFVFMYINDYGHNYLLFLICAIIGIYCCLVFSTFFAKSKIFQWAGEFSICLYVWNFAVCGSCSRITNILNRYIEINPTELSIIGFVLSFAIIVFLAKFTKDRFSFLYGL